MLAKCRDLRALTHFGEMPRFTHFARHKISAARHFQLFCTPAHLLLILHKSPHFPLKRQLGKDGATKGEEKEELGEDIKIYVDLNVSSSGKYTNILV